MKYKYTKCELTKNTNQLFFNYLASIINVHLNKVYYVALKQTSNGMHCYLVPRVYFIHPFSMVLILPGIDMDLANERIVYVILDKLVLGGGPGYRRSLSRDDCNFKP